MCCWCIPSGWQIVNCQLSIVNYLSSGVYSIANTSLCRMMRYFSPTYSSSVPAYLP